MPEESTATPLGKSWALVAGPLSPLEPNVPFPVHSSDRAVRDLADEVMTVRDVKVAGGVNGYANREEKLGMVGEAVVGGRTQRPISRNSSNHAI